MIVVQAKIEIAISPKQQIPHNVNKILSIKAADNIRILSAAMVEKAASGHPGGPMGGADFIHVLYSEYLNFDPNDGTWPLRDRFYLDAGHMSPMLYSQLALVGFYSIEDIKQFRQWKSVTPGHPEIDFKRGVENTSGPLGLGHSFGIGSAIAERFLQARFGNAVEHMTYLYISDGGIQEEISQGVGRIAGTLGLGKIVMFYDANDVQLSTTVNEVSSENTGAKYEALGWHVLTINGNDHDEIRAALDAGIAESGKPTLIIGQTVMGKGVRNESGELVEGEVEYHGKPLGKSNASYEQTISNLGGDFNNPFVIFPDVAEYYSNLLAKKADAATNRKFDFKKWEDANPELAQSHTAFLNKSIKVDWEAIEQKENIATRSASGAVLSHFADHLPNMIVSSADLCVSDKTEAFLKKTTQFTKDDFSGAFLQAGVSELSMAALCTGMALHGGVIPVCATFFAFSDYMKPAIRVAALMEQQVIFIWTHDAFRVGEDGPTHQPIEQEAQIRLMEKLKNHSGRNSFLALRPADAHETTTCWQMAIENTHTPSGLILSRQNIQDIPADDRKSQAQNAKFGGYIVKSSDNPAVVLLANGSEVSTLIGASKLIEESGIAVQVVSIPTEGVFKNQHADYRKSVLPNGVPRYGLTAGLPVALEGLVTDNDVVQGLDHFGYSAPYTVLDEKFGFTPEHVANEVKKLFGKA